VAKKPWIRWKEALLRGKYCPAVDIIKMTHDGQHVAMRPARHHYCGDLFRRGWKQMLDLAALRDDKLFYVYDDVKCLDAEPHGYRTTHRGGRSV